MASDARFVRADRTQTRWDFVDLDALVPSDHRARIVMGFVESLDLSPLYGAIKAREGEPGRPPPDPAVLLALWLYATIEGVGSARQLERLAQHDPAYRWIAGGVPLNYHGLSDFRVAHVAVLDRLLTESVTALIAEGVVSLAEIAVDGTKVRRMPAVVFKHGDNSPRQIPRAAACGAQGRDRKRPGGIFAPQAGLAGAWGAGGEGTRRTGAGRARADASGEGEAGQDPCEGRSEEVGAESIAQ